MKRRRGLAGGGGGGGGTTCLATRADGGEGGVTGLTGHLDECAVEGGREGGEWNEDEPLVVVLVVKVSVL